MNGARTRAGTRIYRCSAHAHLSRSAEPIDDWVSEVAVARLSRDDAVELLRDDKRPDIEVLRTEAAALRSRLGQLGVDFADG